VRGKRKGEKGVADDKEPHISSVSPMSMNRKGKGERKRRGVKYRVDPYLILLAEWEREGKGKKETTQGGSG